MFHRLKNPKYDGGMKTITSIVLGTVIGLSFGGSLNIEPLEFQNTSRGTSNGLTGYNTAGHPIVVVQEHSELPQIGLGDINETYKCPHVDISGLNNAIYLSAKFGGTVRVQAPQTVLSGAIIMQSPGG